MKTILYILTAIMISGILISAIPFNLSNTQECITIQCIDKNADADLMKKSADIIENRFKTVGIKSTKVTINEPGSTIEVCFINKNDVAKVNDLLISKGKFEIYEMFNRADVIKLLEENDKLFSLMTIPSVNDKSVFKSNSILGYCLESDISKVNKYIADSYVSKPDEGILFTWSKFKNKENNVYLYLLESSVSLSGDHIIKVKSEYEKLSKQYAISMNLDETGAKKFQELTQKNVGKELAFVLDGLVYSAPRVMAEIKEGRLMISGDFNADEASFIVALIKNEELPLEFKIVK